MIAGSNSARVFAGEITMNPAQRFKRGARLALAGFELLG
jgi:hypothetical protein